MALFDMCVKHGIHVIAAHMNYQKRDSAKRDMEIVRTYCERHGITFENRMQNKECRGNFQAFAREMRYAFYKELCDQYHADGVLLAHHMDDHLETYIMQKQQKRQASYYGIREETIIMNCHVYRPLLHYTKAELEAYCKENAVPYGIDESNRSDVYTRNRIRHTIIEKMSREEKEGMVITIQKENMAWAQLCQKADAFLKNWTYEIAPLLTLDDNLLYQVLVQYIYENCALHLPHTEMESIICVLRHNAKQWTRDITKAYVIYNEYGRLCIDSKENVSYEDVYELLSFIKTPYYTIASQGRSVEALTLHASDFPITIRNAQSGDEIQLRFGKKKLNRWFIDRKIPKKERKSWPVVVNASGNVILVPEIGCDIAHFSNNPTCFVLK